MSSTAATKTDIYQVVTDRIIGAIESENVAPWHKPWVAEGLAPRNAISGKLYRGVNLWVLGSLGYSDPRYLTFSQAKALGGAVRKGEKGCPVVLWRFRDLREQEAEDGQQAQSRRVPLLKHYTVFNLAQVDGLNIKPWEAPTPLNTGQRIEAAEALIAGMPQRPSITHGYAHAAYLPALDQVQMPDMARFVSEDAYYSTLFHELTHATGYGSRLAREGITSFNGFGSDRYSEEELVAEMGAAFLCAFCGIESRQDQSAAYISGWLARFRQENRLLIKAAGQAQRAADWVRGALTEGEAKERGDSSPALEEHLRLDRLAASSLAARA